MTELLKASELSRSLTGFDEIAIKRKFGAAFEDLDGMFAGRSLYYVHRRREGLTDADAYQAAMSITVGELTDLFEKESLDAEGNEDGSTSNPTPS